MTLTERVKRLKEKYDNADFGPDIEVFLTLYNLALRMAGEIDRQRGKERKP